MTNIVTSYQDIEVDVDVDCISLALKLVKVRGIILAVSQSSMALPQHFINDLITLQRISCSNDFYDHLNPANMYMSSLSTDYSAYTEQDMDLTLFYYDIANAIRNSLLNILIPGNDNWEVKWVSLLSFKVEACVEFKLDELVFTHLRSNEWQKSFLYTLSDSDELLRHLPLSLLVQLSYSFDTLKHIYSNALVWCCFL